MEETISQVIRPNIRFQQNFVSANILMLALAGSIIGSNNQNSQYSVNSLEQSNFSHWKLNNAFKEGPVSVVELDNITQTQVLTSFVEEFLSESVDLDPEISQMVSKDFWELF